MCIWQDGGKPVTKKQVQKEQDCEEQDNYSLKTIFQEWEDDSKLQIETRKYRWFGGWKITFFNSMKQKRKILD